MGPKPLFLKLSKLDVNVDVSVRSSNSVTSSRNNLCLQDSLFCD